MAPEAAATVALSAASAMLASSQAADRSAGVDQAEGMVAVEEEGEEDPEVSSVTQQVQRLLRCNGHCKM